MEELGKHEIVFDLSIGPGRQDSWAKISDNAPPEGLSRRYYFLVASTSLQPLYMIHFVCIDLKNAVRVHLRLL